MALMLLGLIHGVTQSLPRGVDVVGFDTWCDSESTTWR